MRKQIRLPGTHLVPIRQQQGGFVAEGPGFYIWDEDPAEVLRVARELDRGHYSARPTTRLLVVRDDFRREPVD